MDLSVCYVQVTRFEIRFKIVLLNKLVFSDSMIQKLDKLKDVEVLFLEIG